MLLLCLFLTAGWEGGGASSPLIGLSFMAKQKNVKTSPSPYGQEKKGAPRRFTANIRSIAVSSHTSNRRLDVQYNFTCTVRRPYLGHKSARCAYFMSHLEFHRVPNSVVGVEAGGERGGGERGEWLEVEIQRTGHFTWRSKHLEPLL